MNEKTSGPTTPSARKPAFVIPTDFTSLPAQTRVENLAFVSQDGATSHGTLYSLGGERTVLCITHPRGDLSRHYMIPSMLEAGYAVCGFTHRAFINDFAVVHEVMAVDIAGVLRTLKAEKRFGQILLLANSGGGGIFGLYQWQAESAPPGRFTHTPAGDPHDLNSYDLPAADGLILLATPFGESTVVTRGLDPSVADEDDPLSCDPQLDMYDTRNGFREPPQSSSYAAEFVSLYRAAQMQRVARLDAHARSLIAVQREYQAQMQDPGFAKLPLDERSFVRRRALDTKPMVIYRTDASLAYCDLSLCPSKRSVGTFLSLDTQLLNYSRGNLGQFKSPRAWLSASSGLSSRSSLRQALPNIRAPTIIVNYTADRGVYPEDAEEMLSISAAKDKALHNVDGEHFGLPVEGLSDPAPRETVSRLLAGWLRERFAGR
jgi:hypothetical protein